MWSYNSTTGVASNSDSMEFFYVQTVTKIIHHTPMKYEVFEAGFISEEAAKKRLKHCVETWNEQEQRVQQKINKLIPFPNSRPAIDTLQGTRIPLSKLKSATIDPHETYCKVLVWDEQNNYEVVKEFTHQFEAQWYCDDLQAQITDSQG